MADRSDGRGCPQPFVGLVEHRRDHLFLYGSGSSPLVGGFRRRREQPRLPSLIVDNSFQSGGVLNDVAGWVAELGEGVVAASVAARAPNHALAGPDEPTGASHEFVDAT